MQRNKTCPQCNAVVKKGDIREHYCPNIKAMDTAERDAALRDLREEQRKRERWPQSLALTD